MSVSIQYANVTLVGGPSKKGSRNKPQQFSTQTQKVTLWPTWGKSSEFNLGVALHQSKYEVLLRLDVFDWDRYSRNDKLGVCEIALNNWLELDTMSDAWYPLKVGEGVKHRPAGYVRVRLLRTTNIMVARRLHARKVLSDAVTASKLLAERLRHQIRRLQPSRRHHHRRGASRGTDGAPAHHHTHSGDASGDGDHGGDAKEEQGPPLHKQAHQGELSPTNATLPRAVAEATAQAGAVASQLAATTTNKRRALGKQLEVVVLDAKNLIVPPTHAERMYCTVQLGDAVRRTSVVPGSMSIPFQRFPLGLKFPVPRRTHRYSSVATMDTMFDPNDEHDGGDDSEKPTTVLPPLSPLVVAAVDAKTVARAVLPEYAVVAPAFLRPGLWVTHVNDVALRTLRFVDAMYVCVCVCLRVVRCVLCVWVGGWVCRVAFTYDGGLHTVQGGVAASQAALSAGKHRVASRVCVA